MYTKEYVNENKVAVRCKDAEEKLEVLRLITSVGKSHFGGKSGKDIMPRDVNFEGGNIVARYSPAGKDDSICHTDGDYWKSNGYEEITGERFLYDNNILQNYEIY